MKIRSSLLHSGLGRVLAGMALAGLTSYVATATPYATCLTNNAGVVSFRLNEAADAVKVIWDSGASSTNLGAKAKGLTVTNIGVTGTFYVQVAKVGTSTFSTNSPVSFNLARSVAVNCNTNSPYFGRVFVANAGAGTKGDGVYVLNSDLSLVYATNRTAGLDFTTGGTSSPWRLNVGEDDDRLYITDWSDAKGNLWSTDMDLNTNSAAYVLQPLGPCLNGQVNAATDTGNPPGYGNNHGSVAAVVAFGSTANNNLTVITVDEDLQDDRASTTANQMNSVWRYDIGGTALPYNDFFTNRLVTPQIQFVSNVEGLSHGPGGTNGYLYFSQNRSSGNEPGVWVVTNVWTASQYSWNNANVWNSKTASLDFGSSTDILRTSSSVSVSRDGRWLAVINGENNVITVVRLTNGIPDLSRRVQYTGFGTSPTGRDIAWDAADNLYMASAGTATTPGLAMVNSINLGLTATNTTGSDGSFTSVMPPVVSVAATTNIAHRTDVTGNFTFFRDGDLSAPLTVLYAISGTATNGVDYTLITNRITFAAGVGSTNLTIVPLASTRPMPPVTAIITLTANAAYNLVEGRTATVIISDNQVPLLSITPVFTNMYERLPSDFVRFTISRLGETNSAIAVVLTNGGTAVYGLDYSGNTVVTLNAGSLSQNYDFNPVANSTVEGPLSVVIGISPAIAGEYSITNSVATFRIVDSDLAPETVLWSDNFDSYFFLYDTNQLPAGWNAKFIANNGVADYSFLFGCDYSSVLPEAPGSGGTTFGLKMTVNKWDATASAAALNFYPVGQNFGSNYAVRFSLAIVNGTASGTEHAIFGINHSGAKTNWNRSGGVGNASAIDQDGLWFGVNAVGGNSWDYALFTKASGAATSPLVLSNRLATATTQVFKNNGASVGPYAAAGCPGLAYNGAKNWVDVEVAQTPNMVQLKLNNQVIIATTNVTAFTNGNIMIGYNDMFDSIGDWTNAAAYYDNVRVVRIAAPTILTQPVGVTASLGGSASFTVAASTSTTVTNYQWFYNNAAIAGANGATLSIPVVGTTNFGSYYVIVDDGSYPIQSDVVLLAAPAPVIDVQPVSRAAVVGSSPAFTVTATTYSGVTNYQWMYYGTNLGAGTTRTLTLANVQPISFGGPYTVRVNDGVTSVTSAPAAVLTFAVSPLVSGPGLAGTGYALTFNTEAGPNYVVDFKSSLTNATWVPLSTNAGTGGPLTVTNTMSGAEGYYRIRLQ